MIIFFSNAVIFIAIEQKNMHIVVGPIFYIEFWNLINIKPKKNLFFFILHIIIQ